MTSYTQHHIISNTDINKAILVNLQCRTLNFGKAKSSTENTPTAMKHFVPMATHSFPVPTDLISICK